MTKPNEDLDKVLTAYKTLFDFVEKKYHEGQMPLEDEEAAWLFTGQDNTTWELLKRREELGVSPVPDVDLERLNLNQHISPDFERQPELQVTYTLSHNTGPTRSR